jgi:hypothetical protein
MVTHVMLLLSLTGDRMTFNTFVYSGPATTDFIVADTCNIVADAKHYSKLLMLDLLMKLHN